MKQRHRGHQIDVSADIIVRQHQIILAHFDIIARFGAFSSVSEQKLANTSGFAVFHIKVESLVVLVVCFVIAARKQREIFQLALRKLLDSLALKRLAKRKADFVQLVFLFDEISRVHCPFNQLSRSGISRNHYRKLLGEIIDNAHLHQKIHKLGVHHGNDVFLKEALNHIDDFLVELLAKMFSRGKTLRGVFYCDEIALACPEQIPQFFLRERNSLGAHKFVNTLDCRDKVFLGYQHHILLYVAVEKPAWHFAPSCDNKPELFYFAQLRDFVSQLFIFDNVNIFDYNRSRIFLGNY